MTYGEAIRHVVTLAADPSTQIGAKVNGLNFPASREYLALLTVNANIVAKATERRARLRTLPDPFEELPQRYGTPMSRAALQAVLAEHRAHPPTDPDEGRVIKGG